MNINGITPSVSFTGITNPLRMQKLRQARQTLPTMPCDSVHFSQSAKNNIKKVIIMLGAPNSGKGTYANEISAKYSIPQISTGNLLRAEIKQGSEIGLKAKSFIDSGALVPDKVISELLNNRIKQEDCKRGFILDGYPRTVEQAKELGKILNREKNISLNVVHLNVDENILYERMRDRYICADCSKTVSVKNFNEETSKCGCGGKLIKRADDTPEVLAKRLETYKEQSLPLLDMYKDNIMNFEIHDASTPIKENLARVMNALDEVFKG